MLAFPGEGGLLRPPPRRGRAGEGREDGGMSNGQADGRTDGQGEEGRTQVRLHLLYK